MGYIILMFYFNFWIICSCHCTSSYSFPLNYYITIFLTIKLTPGISTMLVGESQITTLVCYVFLNLDFKNSCLLMVRFISRQVVVFCLWYHTRKDCSLYSNPQDYLHRLGKHSPTFKTSKKHSVCLIPSYTHIFMYNTHALKRCILINVWWLWFTIL